MNQTQRLWEFLRVRKKIWLFPFLLMLVLFGALVLLKGVSALAPFLYDTF